MRERTLAAAAALVVLAIIGTASIVAVADDRAGRVSLAVFQPLAEASLPLGGALVRNARAAILGCGAALSLVLLVASFLIRSRARRALLLAFALASAGEVALVMRSSAVGAALSCSPSSRCSRSAWLENAHPRAASDASLTMPWTSRSSRSSSQSASSSASTP